MAGSVATVVAVLLLGPQGPPQAQAEKDRARFLTRAVFEGC